MGSTAGESVTPGRATSDATTSQRPGVWLTDATLVLMAIIWGVNFSVVKYGTTLVDPLAYNALRAALAAALLIAIVAFARMPMPSRRDVFALMALGVLGNGIYQLFFVIGISRTSASDAALVVAASPAFIAIISRVRGVERASPRGIVGIALSIAGIALVVFGSAESSGGHSSISGDLLVLTGSLSWAFYTVWLKPYTERIPGVPLSTWTMIGGAIVLIVVAAPAMLHTNWSAVPPLGWGSVLYSGIFSLVVAYLFWYRGVRVIGPTKTAMFSNLQPVIAVLVAWVMLGETPTIWQGFGTVSIMTGLVLTRA